VAKRRKHSRDHHCQTPKTKEEPQIQKRKEERKSAEFDKSCQKREGSGAEERKKIA